MVTTIPAILFYDVVLAIHIAAVVVALGATFALPFLSRVASRSEWAARGAIHRAELQIERAASFGLIVIIAAGAYLASDRSYWSETWVAVPLVIAIVIGGLAGAVMAPRRRKLATLAESGGGPGYDEAVATTDRVGTLLGLLVLVAIFFMTAKPFA